ncbi:TPA: hypothetical protein DD448_00265 [Candidatus Collierbacteria bacterium]|nr:hypothetical protein [Candidatus Collierbacteria bacterium]
METDFFQLIFERVTADIVERHLHVKNIFPAAKKRQRTVGKIDDYIVAASSRIHTEWVMSQI